MSPNHKMAKYYSSGNFHRHWKFSGIFSCAFVIAFATQIVVLAGSVTFDDDCSNVQCPAEPSLCPPDSLERKPAPVFEELYSPDEFMLPREFYDDIGDHDVQEGGVHQYEEVPPQLSVWTNSASTNTSTIATTTTSSTANPLLYKLVEEPSEPHKESESERTKRELNFDDNEEGGDGYDDERMLRICCNTKPNEQLELRRRRRIRRHSTLEDCECKPCVEMPKCPTGEVAIKTQEAAGTPGDCCPSWACAPKRTCDDIDVQPYWRDACTRCSCYGTKGPELCHDECATLEEQETERACFTADTLQPMEPGSDWYENGFCTKCHCENGVRDCVESLCKPATCKNPLKVPGQCCPQCAEGEENILVAHENSTQLDVNAMNSTEPLPEATLVNTTSATALANTTTETARSAKMAPTELINTTTTTINTSSATTLESTITSSNTSTSEISFTDFTNEESTESMTDLNAYQNQSTSMETIVELFNSSTAASEVFSSSTEITSTGKVIDEIAAEGYFDPINSTSADDNTTVSDGLTEQTSEDTTWSSQATTTTSNTEAISSSTKIYELDATSTTPSTSSMVSYSERSTEESTTNMESINELSTTSSSATTDINTSSVSTASTGEFTTSPATVQETTQTAENTTFSSSNASTATTAHTDFTTSSIPTSSTTISTASITTEVTSTTQAHASETSSPYTSTVVATTSTTSSPFAITSPAQPSTTVTYWYTFSTSAPSPPMPQPTVYQPSVRQFFTRPEVRYIGACVFVAFLSICALAVWKFVMPTRSSTRRKLKNRYRTVPSSEATSLSHSPTTSHSSMA